MSHHFYYSIRGIGVIAEDVQAPKILNIEEMKTNSLVVTDLAGRPLLERVAPVDGWTTEKVIEAVKAVDTTGGADMYFGSQWVGSTEV